MFFFKIVKFGILCISYYFISNIVCTHLLLAPPRLDCCVQASSSLGEWGYCQVAVLGLLVAVASLVVDHGL